LILKVIENASSMLDIVFPLSNKAIATGPHFGSSAFHFASLKLAFVN